MVKPRLSIEKRTKRSPRSINIGSLDLKQQTETALKVRVLIVEIRPKIRVKLLGIHQAIRLKMRGKRISAKPKVLEYNMQQK